MDINTLLSLIAIVIALAIGITLIILYKRRIVDADIISSANEILQGLPVTEGSGVFGVIASYARIAVKTVEQLVKTGVISRDDEARKDAAMSIVENAAKVDAIPFGAAEMDAASACIEAEVQMLPRNQKPPDEASE